MDVIKEQLINACVTEICKEENKKKIMDSVIDPITFYIFKKMQCVLIVVAIFLIILYIKITLILIFLLRRKMKIM